MCLRLSSAEVAALLRNFAVFIVSVATTFLNFCLISAALFALAALLGCATTVMDYSLLCVVGAGHI
ncbi:uncharacterized protein EDB91DRAFT_1169285 [Suillus paluster]|uniref:uncharacterized protein n=1 Tax=Suillus paluster TaxID=48578 RepID=UPI001B880C94|nr:uncharacterized protein EDB91DRAFT_1169285 [Suillus paluster]KAG1725172.1 hypothetical protein EDB91DRAFT_1169285 [Suillus paluster]